MGCCNRCSFLPSEKLIVYEFNLADSSFVLTFLFSYSEIRANGRKHPFFPGKSQIRNGLYTKKSERRQRGRRIRGLSLCLVSRIVG